jgi:hypothetical protein
MPTNYLILGQATPSGSNLDLYSSPAATQTIVSTIAVANVTPTLATATIYVRKATGTTPAVASTGNALALTVPIAGNTTQTFTLGITLAPYDTITVATGTSSSVTFHAFGSQITA